MNITLDGIQLPPDLEWVDEFGWSPVGAIVKTALSGTLIVHEAAQAAGRPITLVARGDGRNYVWLDRATVEALRLKAEIPDHAMQLELVDGRVFTVMFRHDESPGPVEATPVRHIASADPAIRDTFRYTLTLRLRQV